MISRHAEQADAYFDGLRRAEVPALRRVRRDEFNFQPGVDVTDVAQVKGLEFDYVVMVDVNAASYPDVHWARHLLHIGVTRAAHQLWLVSTGEPSPLVRRRCATAAAWASADRRLRIPQVGRAARAWFRAVADGPGDAPTTWRKETLPCRSSPPLPTSTPPIRSRPAASSP